MNSASVYVHFPWCLAKCPYCDFVSYAAPRETIAHRAYADAVIAELDARAPQFGGRDPRDPDGARAREVRSVFFGGGTPSLWEPSELGRVLARIRERLPCAPAEELEVTVECNPTSLDRDRAARLLDVGVNRLSIGTQALRQEQLSYLGRLHDPAGAVRAIEGALAAGVPRVSTDLIFGLPGQPADDARAQALRLADLGVSHLSCYQLTIEPGTQFGQLARRGRLPLADDGMVAEAFVAIDEALTARGFDHYEISNYAKPGEEARHNVGYWRGDEYLGLGCAAYGFLRLDAPSPSAPAPLGVRYRNDVDPARYVENPTKVAARGDVLRSPSEHLDGETLLRERIMLGLRIATGVDVGACARELGVAGWTDARTREANRLVAQGRLTRDGERAAIPRRAWLWADDTAARLF